MFIRNIVNKNTGLRLTIIVNLVEYIFRKILSFVLSFIPDATLFRTGQGVNLLESDNTV